MKLKNIIVGTAILASAVIGDYYNVKDHVIEPLRYWNVKIDSKTYQKPFRLEKKYIINQEGNLEVYLGHDHEWYKIEEDMRINKRTLTDLLKEESDDFIEYLKNKAEEIKEWYEKKQGEGYNGKKFSD